MVRKKHIKFLAITAIIFTFIITSVIISLGNSTVSALTSANLGSATMVGNGVELYDSSTGKFNTTVGSDLVDKLFDNDDPVEYIKTNGANDYNTYKNNYPAGTDPYYVVPSSQIIAKAGVNNNGLVVKLGGLDWMVASLTLADVGTGADEKDNIIMTLYLSDAASKTSRYSTSYANTKGLTMYSSCGTRKDLLNLTNATTDNFSQFALFRGGTFAQKYLVQPKYITYQKVETQYGRQNPYIANADMPNDAYGATTHWNTVSYAPGYSYNGTSIGGTQAAYEDWKEDYIWLPSLTETGASNYLMTSCIWGLTNEQRAHSAQTYSYLRSGFTVNYTAMVVISSSGGAEFSNTMGGTRNTNNGIRPAIHVNITEIAGRLNPADVTATYNGEVQSLDTLKSEISWYRPALSDTSKVRVTYSGTVKNKGEYTVTMTIQESARDYLKWKDWDTNSSPTRTITLKIEQKALSVEFDTSSSPPTATVKDGLCASDSAIEDTILRIRYTGRTGTTAYDSFVEPNQVGQYTATVEINNTVTGSGNYKLDKTYSAQIDINTRQVTLPSVTPEELSGNWSTYDGADHYYTIDYDHSLMEITIATGYQDKFSWDGEIIGVTDAGEYTDALKVKLKNPYNQSTGAGRNVWDSNNDVTDKYLSFTLKKMELKLDFRTDDGKINAPIGSNFSVTLIVSNNKPVNNDRVSIKITALRSGSTLDPVSVYDEYVLSKNSQNAENINLNISSLRVAGSYAIGLVANDPNYTVSMVRDITLVLSRSSQSQDLVWWLWENGNETNFSKNAAIGATDITFDATSLVYNKDKSFSFHATAPFGYSLDGDVQTVRKGSVSVISSATDAGEYVSTVKIKRDGESQSTTYTLNWEIQKAKFDLSAVKWQGDGKVEYTGSDIRIKIDPATLPEGLNANVTCVAGHNVGPCGEASVTFSLESGYEDNYVLPVESDVDSYIYTPTGDMPTTFPWKKEWEIVKAKIVLKWQQTTLQDKNGKDFTAYVLEDDKGVIVYHFYETDNLGNIKDASTFLTISDMEIVDNQRLYFKVKPEFINNSFANNYELASDYSPVFEFGEFAEAVEVDISNKTFIYNGKVYSANLQLLSGTIGINQFDFVYYDRGATTPLASAPTNAGLYTVAISIKAGVNGFYLSGANVQDGKAFIDFEISKRVVDNSTWITSHNPPSLQLTFADMGGILYEYSDMSGNIITFADIKPGNTYKVRARIKDANNYEFLHDFNGDLFNTDWVEFTVSANEQLYDPLDPSNPFYPEDPDNPVNPGGPGDGDGNDGSVLDKIKEFFDNLIKNNFPLWQICTMAVAGLLTLIFLIKSIQYGNRRKKAKGEAKKISSRTYAGLLPVFATDIVLAGLSNQVWSIMAFAFVGLAVLMFIVALITRKQWKKAELAKENALEDREQRKFETQNQNQLALQERITQIGQNGLAVDNSLFEQRLLELEERRREEEARHRAELAELREEQARRDEEQAKRDEAMKLMLANMMGRAQGNSDDMPIYGSMDDTDLLVQKVIAGLLPAVQQMIPEQTAYLTAPAYEESEELKNLVEEQNEQMRNMTDKINELQQQISDMNENRVEAEIIPDNSEEIKALTDEVKDLKEQLEKGAKTENSVDVDDIADKVAQRLTPAQTDVNVDEIVQKITAQITPASQSDVNVDEIVQKVSEKISTTTNNTTIVQGASDEEMQAMAERMAQMQQQIDSMAFLSVDELDDTDFDDEEEWDSILDEDDDDFVEAVIIEEGGTVRKTTPNFRMRLKQSSEKNREWYTVIKNMFCSQKGVTYRVCKRVEKIRYQGQVVGVIGIAKRSIKLWLALKPYEYDARRYHHKDVSDKPRFVDVPMYIRIGSDRALTRAQELILALFQELNMEARKRYNDRGIQELIFTLKHNKLLTNKQNKQLLCEVMHVHDCDILSDELAEKCVEFKNVDFIDDSLLATVKLDDIDTHFQDGNRVTLDKLKKIGLVSEECTGFTVNADKRLTKPLIIVANDFTMTATKLIVLTGGRAIKLTQV